MRVLVIEDNPADAALVRALLAPYDLYTTTVATRVSDAVGLLSGETFDVALLDMSLPDAEGFEALARIRQASPFLPIVVLSGQRDEELATAIVAAGAQDFLLKGHVTEVTLRRALGYAIERQQMLDRINASVDELEDQRAAVIRVNQLKNDLITILAHDFKGPLTTILGYAELIEEGALEGDDARDAAGTIRRNVFRLTTLAATTVAGTEVPGDRERLRQVFENLLRNALKYSGDEAIVSVAVRDGEAGFVRVDITDRGIGIPQDELPMLFRRFSRASNAKKARIPGTGLGLFVAKTLVEKHGGKLTLTTEVGRGSTFSVALPRKGAIERAPHVSVVAGDATLGPFIAYELRSNGYRVREYRTLDDLTKGYAAEGNRRARKVKEPPSIGSVTGIVIASVGGIVIPSVGGIVIPSVGNEVTRVEGQLLRIASSRPSTTLRYARDDNFSDARDDNFSYARDDNFSDAHDDKFSDAHDDKFDYARDDISTSEGRRGAPIRALRGDSVRIR